MSSRILATAIAAGCIVSASVPAVRARQSQSASPQSPAVATPPPAGRGASPFQPPEPLDFSERAGWTSLFDGRSLAGWSGNPEVWRVENGVITAVSTAERRVGSTHIIWQGGEPADFELKLEVKLDGDIHSGIAYRSVVDVNRATGRQGAGAARGRSGAAGPQVPADPRWTLYGPGLDFDQDRVMAGNVEDRGTPRREVAWRGGIVRADAGQRPRLIGTIGDADALMKKIDPNGWNQVHIVARGNTLTHIINGQLMTVLIDDDPTYFKPSGRLGLQIEMYGLGRVSFREIWLKQLSK
jgi:hypothetical protein